MPVGIEKFSFLNANLRTPLLVLVAVLFVLLYYMVKDVSSSRNFPRVFIKVSLVKLLLIVE